MRRPPNLIYILTDDQRADHLGCAGHPVLRTPHLDQLAADGVRFRNACCTSALCTPSRASHYTGLWERAHGVNFNSRTALSEAAWQRGWLGRLKQAGYFLGWVGKNHVPVGLGGYGSGYLETFFDFWYGHHGHAGFYPAEQCQRPSDRALFASAVERTQPEVFAAAALDFIDPDADPEFARRCPRPLPRRPADQPFCLCVTYNLPHGGGVGSMALHPEDDELYKTAYRDQWRNFPEPVGAAPWESAVRLPRAVWNGHAIAQYDWIKEDAMRRERQVRICQSITGIDRGLGRMRATLDRLGLADNTIIVFSSDHGETYGEWGVGGKLFLWEPNLRIPLIIHDPRQGAARRGQVRDELVVVPDLAPTVLDLLGCAADPDLPGRSVAPLLRGERPAWRDGFFCENLFDGQNYPRCDGLRTTTWKYIRYFPRSEDPAQSGNLMRGTLDAYAETRLRSLAGEAPIHEELYHLGHDPHERRNLAADPAYADALAECRARLQREGRQALQGRIVADTVPLNR